MANETWEQRARARWDQLMLFPPESTRIDFSVFLPSDGAPATMGWRVTTFPEGDVVEIEVAHGVRLELVPELAGRDLTAVVRRFRDDLPPFP